jgi:tetratricopeptide (TPR) repeat protein
VRTNVLARVVCVAFLMAGGLFVRATGPERKFDQGLACLRANQPEQACYCLVSIDHRPDYHSQASLLRGWLRLQSHQADEAEDYMAIWADLSDALEVRRCRPLTLALMGRLLYEGGRFANALDVLNGALAEDPDEIEAHRWLGSALYDVGAVVPALEHLRRVAQEEVSNARICRLIGLIYREHADFSDAAAAYEESLRRDPAQPDADRVRIDLARCRLALHDYGAALAALEGCEDTPDALALRGLCHVGQGQPQRAREFVEQALRRDADNAAALSCLAKIDASQAAELLSQAVERRPNDYELREQLGATYRSLGEEDLAYEQERLLQTRRSMRAELDQLLKQANDNLFDAALRYRIADLAARLDMPELAADWQKAARLLNSSSAGAAPLPMTPPP